jgi:hypothetical protein
LYKEDINNYFDKRPFLYLKRLSYSEFGNIFERILLLEYSSKKICLSSTINRIICGKVPYDYGLEKTKEEEKDKKKRKEKENCYFMKRMTHHKVPQLIREEMYEYLTME